MTERERKLVIDYATRKLSEEQFLGSFPVDPRIDKDYVLRELESALSARDADAVEWALWLAFRFGLSPAWAAALCRLLDEDWHHDHEDIARALQRLRDPQTVDCLYRAALARFEYRDYDESESLAVKCIWALFEIGTDSAREKLEALANSTEPIIKEKASERLRELRGGSEA